MFLSNCENYAVQAARILIPPAGYKQVSFSIKIKINLAKEKKQGAYIT